MLALLSSLLWPAPLGVERAIADVAAELRSVPREAREVPAVERCATCLRVVAPGVLLCWECELMRAAPGGVA